MNRCLFHAFAVGLLFLAGPHVFAQTLSLLMTEDLRVDSGAGYWYARLLNDVDVDVKLHAGDPVAVAFRQYPGSPQGGYLRPVAAIENGHTVFLQDADRPLTIMDASGAAIAPSPSMVLRGPHAFIPMGTYFQFEHEKMDVMATSRVMDQGDILTARRPLPAGFLNSPADSGGTASESPAAAEEPVGAAVGVPMWVTVEARIDSMTAAPNQVFHGKVVTATSLTGAKYGDTVAVPKGAVTDFVIRGNRLAMSAVEVDGKVYPVNDVPLLPTNSANTPLRPQELLDSHESISGHITIRGLAYFRLEGVRLVGDEGAAEADSGAGHDPATFDVMGAKLMMSGKEALAALEAHTKLKARLGGCPGGAVPCLSYGQAYAPDAKGEAPKGWIGPNYITRVEYTSAERQTSVIFDFAGAPLGQSSSKPESLFQIRYETQLKTVADREQFYNAVLEKYGPPRFKYPVTTFADGNAPGEAKTFAYEWGPETGDRVVDLHIPVHYPYMEMQRSVDSGLVTSTGVFKLVASPKYKKAYDDSLAKAKKDAEAAKQKQTTTKKPEL